MGRKHPSTKPTPIPAHAARPRRRIPIWLPGAVLVALLVILGAVGVYVARQESQGRSPFASSKPADPQRLVGKWARTDGDYVIDVRKIAADGKLDAAYLNPRPINVAKAESKTESGKLTVFVELRDEGYPGNYYTLTHDAQRDTLTGVYHQLGQGQQYPVEFERLP